MNTEDIEKKFKYIEDKLSIHDNDIFDIGETQEDIQRKQKNTEDAQYRLEKKLRNMDEELSKVVNNYKDATYNFNKAVNQLNTSLRKFNLNDWY